MVSFPKTPTTTAPRKQVTVFVGGSSRLACEMLERVLCQAGHIRVVGWADTAAETVAGIRTTNPHIALLAADLAGGPQSGFGAVRDIGLLHLRTHIIMMLDSAERPLVVEAFRAGVKGVFCRKDGVSALYKCVDAVHSGQIWANSLELQFLLEALSATTPLRMVNAKGEDLLTRREIDVVVLVAEGMSNRQISEKLQLSEHTIKNYLFRIFDKLGVSSRAELILYALAQRDLPQQGRSSFLSRGSLDTSPSLSTGSIPDLG